MPKLHKLNKRFLKRQGYKECLANGLRLQTHEKEVKVNNAATNLRSNNQPNGGESLLNGRKEEKSKMNNNRKTGVKRRRSPDVETSSADESNRNNGNRNHARGSTNNSSTNMAMSTEAPAAAASVNLKRRDQQNIIWVRIGLTDHPAYELYNPDNPNSNDSSNVWVEYASNGDKECVQRSNIKTGLQDRRRHRPNYDETGRRK